MKNVTRLMLGTLASLLFAVGLSRAAESLDPMSVQLGKVEAPASFNSGPDTSQDCALL